MQLVDGIVVKRDELSEVKGQFLASLNHEIRTPLSGILGMTDLLLETQLTEEQKEYVGATRVCADNLLEILNAALDFSALSANHIEPEEAEFPLRETLEGLITEFSFRAASKGLHLRRNFEGDLPDVVIGDALRLRQMLWHLIANAVKFTDRGEVEVGASAGPMSGNTVPIQIHVRDTGIGIPADHLHSVFESFHQLETGLARNYAGLGLGLAVAQKLAQLLRGEINVQSEVGKGSTFAVRLSLSLPAEAIHRRAEKKSRGRVLVVDDNSIAQTITSHVLRRCAFEVECVANGQAAIDKATHDRFDLILMDLQMPGMDGFETAKALRSFPAYEKTPIVAVTANCSNDYRDLCRDNGMQGFLSKPVQSGELVKTVEKHLAACSNGAA